MILGRLAPGVGGAMDLATGAKKVMVAIQRANQGRSLIVCETVLPSTPTRPVDPAVAYLAVFEARIGRLVLIEHAAEITIAALKAKTKADFDVATDVRVLAH